MSKRQNTWKNTPAVGQQCARVGMRTLQTNFVQPFKGFKYDDEEEWIDTLGLTKLLKVMRASYGLAEYGYRYTEFILEFRILNEGPPLRYASTVTILEGESPRKYEIDADFLSRLFKIPQNPDGMQLGRSREGRWPEGGKYFENDTKTYDKKKGWRLEKLKPEYKHWKKRYELPRRLIWFGKRSDFVGNGQARAIRDVLTCADLERPDRATSLLRSFAHEIISIQKTAARLPNRCSVTYIGPIIRHILYPELFNTLQETSSQAADSADDPNKMELDLVSEQPDPGDNDSGVSADMEEPVRPASCEACKEPIYDSEASNRLQIQPSRNCAEQLNHSHVMDTHPDEVEVPFSLKAWNYGGSRTTGNGPKKRRKVDQTSISVRAGERSSLLLFKF